MEKADEINEWLTIVAIIQLSNLVSSCHLLNPEVKIHMQLGKGGCDRDGCHSYS